MSLLTDVHAYLSANSQGTNLFIGSLPDSPDAVAVLYPAPGLPPREIHNRPGVAQERPGLQVVVRSAPNGWADAEARAYAIYRLLQVSNATLGSGFYQRLMPMGSPFLRERDANRRAVIAVNFIAIREWV